MFFDPKLAASAEIVIEDEYTGKQLHNIPIISSLNQLQLHKIKLYQEPYALITPTETAVMKQLVQLRQFLIYQLLIKQLLCAGRVTLDLAQLLLPCTATMLAYRSQDQELTTNEKVQLYTTCRLSVIQGKQFDAIDLAGVFHLLLNSRIRNIPYFWIEFQEIRNLLKQYISLEADASSRRHARLRLLLQLLLQIILTDTSSEDSPQHADSQKQAARTKSQTLLFSRLARAAEIDLDAFAQDSKPPRAPHLGPPLQTHSFPRALAQLRSHPPALRALPVFAVCASSQYLQFARPRSICSSHALAVCAPSQPGRPGRPGFCARTHLPSLTRSSCSVGRLLEGAAVPRFVSESLSELQKIVCQSARSEPGGRPGNSELELELALFLLKLCGFQELVALPTSVVISHVISQQIRFEME